MSKARSQSAPSSRFQDSPNPCSTPCISTSTLAFGGQSPKPKSILKSNSCACRRLITKEAELHARQKSIRRSVTFSGLDQGSRWDSYGSLHQKMTTSTSFGSIPPKIEVDGNNASWTSSSRERSTRQPRATRKNASKSPPSLPCRKPSDENPPSLPGRELTNNSGDSSSRKREDAGFSRTGSDSSIPNRKPRRRVSLKDEQDIDIVTKLSSGKAFESLTLLSLLDAHHRDQHVPHERQAQHVS